MTLFRLLKIIVLVLPSAQHVLRWRRWQLLSNGGAIVIHLHRRSGLSNDVCVLQAWMAGCSEWCSRHGGASRKHVVLDRQIHIAVW